jgi:acetylglutamate kinase
MYPHNENQKKNSEETNENQEDPDKNSTILVKFGGNAMVNKDILNNVLSNICDLNDNGYKVVIVHGGGPEISRMLDIAGLESEFIGGHRKTDSESMTYVEMALKGRVNGELVRIINANGKSAVGVSGKDGKTVLAKKRYHEEIINGKSRTIDLGLVGDVDIINPDLIYLLLDKDYIPVVATISTGHDFENYNINADMFAGHLAAALDADHYIVLTDVDGLLLDKDDPNSLIPRLEIRDIRNEFSEIILGGMIPKVESCIIALEGGVRSAYIVNGTTRNILNDIFLKNKPTGTIIQN